MSILESSSKSSADRFFLADCFFLAAPFEAAPAPPPPLVAVRLPLRSFVNADVFWFPMYAAVQKQNYLVAKWLFQEGAVKDLVCMHVRGHPSPIKILFTQVLATEAKEATCLAKWFVTQGAIQFWMQARVRTFCGNKEIATLGNDVGVHHLEWSGDLIRSTSAFHLFLLGTLPAPQYSASALEKASSKARLSWIG